MDSRSAICRETGCLVICARKICNARFFSSFSFFVHFRSKNFEVEIFVVRFEFPNASQSDDINR